MSSHPKDPLEALRQRARSAIGPGGFEPRFPKIETFAKQTRPLLLDGADASSEKPENIKDISQDWAKLALMVLPNPALIVDEHLAVHFLNSAASSLMSSQARHSGEGDTKMPPHLLQRLVTPEDADLLKGVIKQVLRTGSTTEVSIQSNHNKQRPATFKVQIVAMPPDAGAALALVLLEHFFEPVSEPDQQGPSTVAGSQESLLLNEMTDYVFATDRQGLVTYANPAYLTMLGKDSQQVLGKRHETILPLTNAIGHVTGENKVIASGESFRMTEVLYLPGQAIELEVHKFPLRDLQSRLIGVGSVARDMTASNETQHLQKLSEAIFQSTREAIVLTDPQGRILRVNPGWERITGFSEQAVLSKRLSIVHSGRQNAHRYREIWRDILEHGHWSGELVNRKSDGSDFVVWSTINALLKADGQLLGYLAVQTDITELRKAHELIDMMAKTDELTGLPNRKQLLERLHHLIRNADQQHTPFALLFLDLDHFKDVNDSLGHHIGDNLLIRIGERLKAAIRVGDTVARLGGDEFTMLLPATDLNQAGEIAHQIMKAIRNPLMLDGLTSYRPQASIGIAMYPQDGKSAQDLLMHADQAMYAAKHKGRNQTHVYSEALDINNQRTFALRRELSEAFGNNELRIFLQPVFELATMKVVGAESLVRWQHPRLGLLSPGEFLPIAQASRMMGKIDRWVLDQTLLQTSRWLQQGLIRPDWRTSLNQNTDDLKSPEWANSVKALLDSLKLPPKMIGIELTEELWAEPLPTVLANLEFLKQIGLTLYIDDFGTGYSSLAYLKELPASVIKIDQHFVRQLDDEKSDATLVEAIISLAKKLQFDLVAEGVETQAQRIELIKRGCDRAQGYLLSPPVPVEEFERKFLSANPQSEAGVGSS